MKTHFYDCNCKEERMKTYTVDDALNAVGFGWFQIILTLVIGLALMCEAVEMMVLSILAPILQCKLGVSPWKQALMISIIFACSAVGSPFWGWIADKYGRKVEIIMATVWTFYFGLLSVFSPSFMWIFLLRSLLGFGIGGNGQFMTIYSEFLPTNNRGKALTLVMSFWSIGAIYTIVVSMGIFPQLSWRYLLGFASIPSLIFIFVCPWLPESARFHFASGQPDKVIKTLERIARYNRKSLPAGKLIDGEQSEERGQFLDLFKNQLTITTLFTWIQWFVIFFGYHGVTLLTTILYAAEKECKVGKSLEDEVCLAECKLLSTHDYLNILYTIFAEFLALILVAFVVDIFGRKHGMVLSYGAFGVSVALMSICYNRTLTTVLIFFARGSVIAGCQATFTYTAEIYPTTIRAVGVGSAGAVGRIGAVLTPYIAEVTSRISIYLAFTIYAASGLIAAGTAALLPIETRGRKMKESTKE